ncbi:33218_t:CDS:10, partial [Gigaspora margarita]
GVGTNRRMEFRENIYDIWYDSNTFKKRINSNDNYAFIDYIYETIKSSENLNNGIMEYQYILTKHKNEVKGIIAFVNQRLLTNETKEQALFLCVFLGYYMDLQNGLTHKPCLPYNFPSAIAIKKFKSIDYYHSLPSNAKSMLMKAIIRALVQHNSKLGSLDWITIFALAPKFDASYSFIDSIEIYAHKNQPDYFINLLKEIKPCINNLKNSDPKVLNKTLNMLIKKSFDEECLAHMQEFFKDFVDNNFKNELRKKLLELLKGQRLYWNSERISSFHRLFKDPDLDWQHREYIIVLKIIAESNQNIVLEYFPEFFKFISGLNLSKHRSELERQSVKWFINICKESSTLDIFRYLSMMHSTSTFGREILKKLLNHNIVMSLSDDNIFSVASEIGDFHEDVITHFISLIKDRVGAFVEVPDERLLEKIMRICDSTKSLNIRNRSCEEILCFILGRLQQIKNVKFSEIESFQLSLFQFAKFWMIIFKAKGCTNKLRSHSYFKETCEMIIHITTSIKNQTITIRMLQKIFNYFVNNNRLLTNYINCAIENYPGEYDLITYEDTEKNCNQCYEYNSILERLQKFYRLFCPSQLVSDVKQYFDDLAKRSSDATLKELYVKDHWSMHSIAIEIMKDYYHFIESQTFYNIFQVGLKAKITVKQVMNTTIKEAIENYTTNCKEYDNWEEIKCSVASEFWKNINVEHVYKEINFMIPYADKLKSSNNIQNLNDSVKLLVKISPALKRLRRLQVVIKALGVIPCNQSSWAEVLISELEDKELLLRQLHKIFNRLDKNEKMSSLTNDVWSTIIEISSAIDFVIFLKSLVGHDLTHLINGVDDHSDERLIQENTVQTFIQVKQIMEPLFEESWEEGYEIQEFLQMLRGIIKKNPSLVSKLRQCNADARALMNLYRSISNRGEMTKEKIFHSVTKGVYLFERMKLDECRYTATLSYPSDLLPNSITKYTFSELQDLRSRAKIINTKAFIDAKTLDNKSIKPNELTLAQMNNFIIGVDLAQEIIDTASSLKELGHFKYRDFHASTRSIQDMEKLLQTLSDDLQNWETIVNRAQQNHYYLTFFLAQHILNFYDYFSCNKNIANTRSDIKEKCSMFLRYVNDKAKLPNINSDIIKISLKPKNYYDILCKIGTIFYGIFSQIPIIKRQMTTIINHETVKVRQGHLFIAKCNNKFRVPNIIMSLCNLHNKCYPEAWQLLICKSSNTEEELLTFTKRCFFAAKNGYGEHLFIIANVELLDFELQYQLVSSIRSLCQQEKQFYLALICCLENSMHHHILDQFSEHAHVIQGINAESMHNIYKELCPNVLAVSSDLSGQGKTKWIEKHSSTHEMISRKFLISDGRTFEILVHKLSEIRLLNTESLHLTIMLVDHHYDANMFIFEFLSFKIVKDRKDFLSISPTQIYIEVMNQDLLTSIPIIGYLEKTHLTWNINNTIILQDVDSPIQIVTRYLDAYDRDTINTNDIDTKQLISESHCRQLLQKHFFDKVPPDIKTYRFLEIFVNVLADQLKRMSSSAFFLVNTLQIMAADKDIRKTLLETLIGVSMDFATRSVNSKKEQHNNLFKENNNDISITTIKHWEDSNHLLVFFLSQSPDSICALYRDVKKVPRNVENLLKSQHFPANSNFALDNYDNMSCEDILKKLECLARITHEEREYAPYALSTDNLLKMALILLRARANVPVVICGEAGCGKTSLIKYLSEVVNVKFEILNLHAGVTKEQILEFLFDAEVAAEKSEIWLFFDEINTCNHIGILADLIAHRLLLGKEIHKNIRLFAACNPYRFRQKAYTQAGLLTDRYEEKNSLVYQVRPLPDQILDYVWDYGVLKPSDEKIYINIMVKKTQKDPQSADLFAELLFASQEFVRTHEGVHSVSLRDVKRAMIIFEFFCKSIAKRQELSEETSEEQNFFLRTANNVASNIKSYIEGRPNDTIKSYILALSLCYQVRFFDQKLRNQYQDRMCEIFKKLGVEINSKIFTEIVQEEQKDFMKRMTKPSMVAENFALLENVLAITVCILTRIPLFIIGAPGASKSLAVRLVSQSLRGKDSNDSYFRTLPQVYPIPHQGSSSSTSDGIITVFDKADNYQKGDSEEYPLITVVLLDEIGLAEKSPHNPLKVLHSLLEPTYPEELPKVAVIGISNWRLDNSKSSRALLVQRPNLEKDDLIDTTRLLLGKGTELQFQALADSYLEYKKANLINNFHGLRDYFFLVKSLSGGEYVQMALARNFGGISEMDELYRVHFNKVMTEFDGSIDYLKNYSIEDLIKSNLKDKNARHLMIIGKSNSIVNILMYKLKQWNKELTDANLDLEPVIIYGSQFPDDFGGDYQYSILSSIMMCVEEGRPLILTDLDTIYGSLYDLWNQNYITVGKEGNQTFYTRVALGAYSNPMVCVHENFRCILVLNEKDVYNSDPPLLNRFEKQRMTISDIIDDDMENLLKTLKVWSKQISTLVNVEKDITSKFNENDIFIGFDKEEALQSLVIHNFNNNPESKDEILHKCKELLIGIALPDGIVRSKKSMLSNNEVDYWHNFYFQQNHEDLPSYIRSLLRNAKNARGFSSIIYTFSNVNTDIESCLKKILNCQVDKLSTFKSEAQFRTRIKHFWLESRDNILILQCDLDAANSECIKLAKFIIEQYKNQFMANRYSAKQVKHVCIILHLRKENLISTISSFNFMCGWDLFTIETLTPQEHSSKAYLDKDLISILETIYTFEDVVDCELIWCLTRIEFPSSYKSADYIKSLAQKIPRHKQFMNWMKDRTIEYLHNNQFKDWQLEVAINKKDLYLSSSFLTALQTYIRHQVREPIARLLYALEKLGGLLILDSDDLFNEANKNYNEDSDEENATFTFWEPIIMDTEIVNIEIKMPYIITDSLHDSEGECNQCKNKIGGLNHILNEGSSSIDEDKIKQSIAVNDKQGYIIEDTFDTYYTVRTLHPASYRILHLFLHIIIGIQAHLPTTIAFINNQDAIDKENQKTESNKIEQVGRKTGGKRFRKS